MSTTITTKTHPTLTAAERRAERARTEGSSWKITFLALGLTRKSDGKHGEIRFAQVYTRHSEQPYTVRLNNQGQPCRCSCEDWKRRADAASEAGLPLSTVEPCKHMLRVALCGGQDQEPAEVEKPLPAPPFDVEEEARMARALKDRELWD